MSTTRIKTFGTEPYYDDFFTQDLNEKTVEEKNYHRILFRPGYSVQARELTQLQTALQAQIDRHGQYAFKHGSRVVGGKVTLNTEHDFIKIESSFTHTVGGALNSDEYLSTFVGKIITGENNSGTQIQAKVLLAVAASDPDPNTLYIKYITKGGADRNVDTFAAGEEFVSDGTTIIYGIVGGGSGSSIATPTGQGSIVNIEKGVYFISGTFIHVPAGSLILDKYTNTPSYTVGLAVTESVIDSGSDLTLLDNAQGVPNTSAPGATRYQISTALVKESLTDLNSTNSNYVTLLRIEDGIIQVDKTDTANNTTELSKRLARRTFEESGNYSVKPFQLDIREHLDTGTNNGWLKAPIGSATKIAIGIEPSAAYVQGYRNENIATKYVVIDKPRGTDAVNVDANANVATPVGNYVLINESTVKGIPDVSNFSTMDLHNATGQGGSVVGTARARAIEKIGTELRLHLFDIKMSSGNFSAVRSFNQDAGDYPDFVADVATIDGVITPTRIDVGNNTMVFKLPYAVVKTLFNGSTNTTEYTIKKDFDGTVSSNEVTISLGPEEGHFTNVNSATMISVGTTAINTAPSFVGAPNDGVTTLRIAVSAADTTKVRVQADVEIDGSDKEEKQKLREPDVVASNVSASSDGSYSLGKADIIRLVSVVDATDTNVTERFTLDNGQRDNFYDIGRIIQNPGTSPVSGALTIKFDYYRHQAGDYFTVILIHLTIMGLYHHSTQQKVKSI